MLKKMTLKNYTTFMEEVTFDFSATGYKFLEKENVGKNKILKGSLFVGENASGKSQALKAILLLLKIVLGNEDVDFKLLKSLYTKKKTFSFSYLFDIEGHDVLYEIEMSEDAIIIEKLSVDNEVLLDRIDKSGISYLDEKRKTEIDSKISFIRMEAYKTNFENHDILVKWKNFLKNSIYINCLDRRVISFDKANEENTNILRHASLHDTKKVNQFMDKIGYESEFYFYKKLEETMILMKKKDTSAMIPLTLESDGNQALAFMILPFDYLTTHNGMLIIDEFSSGLHNALEEALLKYFYKNSRDSQMFFVSHSTNILDTSIIRPDQIYSFHFDKKLGTKIYRFSSESPRESQNMEKMYLSGVFDGMPEYKVQD